MSSQKSAEEVLLLIETLSREDLQEKIDDFLPTLTSSLSVEDENFRAIKIVHVLLNTCLPLVKIHNAETQILKYALPVLKQLFIESVNGIRFKLQLDETTNQSDVVDHVDGLLKVCLLLLESVESGLQYIHSSEKVDINELPSLPKTVGVILLEAFKHCKESEKLYGEFFQHLSEDLSILFKKSHTVQGQLMAALTNNICFNCVFEEDVILLIEVLDILEEIGEIVTGLDIKTMANQWKFYAKIVQDNAENLKQRLDIARPVKFFSMDIATGLQNVLESDLNDSKNITKNIKLLNFMLKLVMLFSELFAGYLGDCHDEILNLMLNVLSYSKPYLQLKKVPNTMIEEIENYLVIGIEPLLSRLISGDELPKAYFQFGSTLEHNENLMLGFLLLTNMILKSLTHHEEEVRRNWLQSDPDCNIICVLFRSLSYCHVELTLDLRLKGSCKGPDFEGVDSTHGLYESLLIHLSAFLTTISASKIKMLEGILFENIMQGNIWRALMAVDVWCMIARCGSAEFCFQQVSQLSKFYKKMSCYRSCPETSYLRMLLGRLFSLLSNKDMLRMAELFPPISNTRLWLVFGLSKLPVQIKTKIQEDLLINATDKIDRFFSSSPTVNAFMTMADALAGAAAALESLPEEEKKDGEILKTFVAKLTQLWASIPTLSNSQDKSVNWLDNYINDVSTATNNISKVLANDQILQILQILKNKMLQNFHSIKIASLKFVRSLADKFFNCDTLQTKLFCEVASLFSLLLKDDNVLIQQMSLETFIYFSHHTKHERIVALSVSDSDEVKEAVRKYLKKIPFQVKLGEKTTFEEFLKKQLPNKVVHHCRTVNKKTEKPLDVKSNESVPIFTSEVDSVKTTEIKFESQKRKSEDDLFVIVKRMKEDVNYITEAFSQKVLPPDIQNEVLEMACKLTNMR